MKPIYYLAHPAQHADGAGAYVTGSNEHDRAAAVAKTHNAAGASLSVSAYIAASDVAEALRECAADPAALAALAAELENFK